MRGSACLACPSARRELVSGMSAGGVVLGAFTGKSGKRALDLAPHVAHRDTEDALAPLHQIDDLLGGGALVHAGPVAHQGDPGEVLDATLTQMADGDADLLQGDPAVQEPLDHLEDQDVAKAVETLGP